MQHTMWIAAGEHERFAPHSWDSQVGKEVPVNLRDTDDGPVRATLGRGRVTAAEVAEDGSGVTLTIEIPDPPGVREAAEDAARRGGFSFRVPDMDIRDGAIGAASLSPKPPRIRRRDTSQDS